MVKICPRCSKFGLMSRRKEALNSYKLEQIEFEHSYYCIYCKLDIVAIYTFKEYQDIDGKHIDIDEMNKEEEEKYAEEQNNK